jgi:hypothetical protein
MSGDILADADIALLDEQCALKERLIETQGALDDIDNIRRKLSKVQAWLKISPTEFTKCSDSVDLSFADGLVLLRVTTDGFIVVQHRRADNGSGDREESSETFEDYELNEALLALQTAWLSALEFK